MVVPSAKRFLELAHKWQARLSKPGAPNKTKLAGELGITPTRLGQVLLLLKLSPEVQAEVMAMEPTACRTISERRLRPITSLPKRVQLPAYRQLLARFHNKEAA